MPIPRPGAAKEGRLASSDGGGSPAGRAEPRAGGLAGKLAAWLSLTAAPVFALMAALTATLGGGPGEGLCSAAPGAAPFQGMTLMYGLMSVFHAPPWLRLLRRA